MSLLQREQELDQRERELEQRASALDRRESELEQEASASGEIASQTLRSHESIETQRRSLAARVREVETELEAARQAVRNAETRTIQAEQRTNAALADLETARREAIRLRDALGAGAEARRDYVREITRLQGEMTTVKNEHRRVAEVAMRLQQENEAMRRVLLQRRGIR